MDIEGTDFVEIVERCNLKTGNNTVFSNGVVLRSKILGADEIFDKYKDYLSPEQIRDLFNKEKKVYCMGPDLRFEIEQYKELCLILLNELGSKPVLYDNPIVNDSSAVFDTDKINDQISLVQVVQKILDLVNEKDEPNIEYVGSIDPISFPDNVLFTYTYKGNETSIH